MKVFHAKYSWYGSRGAYEEKEVIVVAESKEEALLLVQASYADTTVENCWTIEEEISLAKSKIYQISGRCS